MSVHEFKAVCRKYDLLGHVNKAYLFESVKGHFRQCYINEG